MSKPKLLEKIDNAGGVFIATYGTTTYQEIKDAYDSGKDVVCYYSNSIYDLCTIPTGSNQLYFYNREYSATNRGYANTSTFYFYLNSSNTWYGLYGTTPSSMGTSVYRNNSTSISSSTGYYRPIRLSTAEPTSSDGYVGDIWIQYEE